MTSAIEIVASGRIFTFGSSILTLHFGCRVPQVPRESHMNRCCLICLNRGILEISCITANAAASAEVATCTVCRNVYPWHFSTSVHTIPVDDKDVSSERLNFRHSLATVSLAASLGSPLGASFYHLTDASNIPQILKPELCT